MRHVFFSFHYKRDIFRANVVRNSWVAKGGEYAAEYRDFSMWESARTRDDDRLASMIKRALHGTSVTVVLIGAETASRYWVQHEIQESWVRGNGLLGVYIHGIADMRDGRRTRRGTNPFAGVRVRDELGRPHDLGRLVPTYDWRHDDGSHYFAEWVEAAAQDAGR